MTKKNFWTEEARKVWEEGKMIPLSEFTVHEFHEVMWFNKNGPISPASETIDQERLEWWKDKISRWKGKQYSGLDILKN